MSMLIANQSIQQNYPNQIYISKLIHEMQRGNPLKVMRKQDQIIFMFKVNYLATQIDIVWHFIFKQRINIKIQFINNSYPGKISINFIQQRLYTQILHAIKILNRLKISNGMNMLLSSYGSIYTFNVIPPWIREDKIIEYISYLKTTIDNVVNYVIPYLSLLSTRVNQNQQAKQSYRQKRIYQIKKKYQHFRIIRQKLAEVQFQEVPIKARKHIESIRILVQCMNQQPILKSNKLFNSDQIKKSIDDKFKVEKQPEPTQQKQSIMMGLILINVLQKINQSDSLAKGNHSNIQISKYQYQIIPSIDQFIKIFEQEIQKNSSIGSKIFEGFLVKKIPLLKQVSINSIRNQIAFLKFIRNNHCQYIANYYLQVPLNKQELYISYYKQTLYQYNYKQKKGAIYLSTKKKLKMLREIVQGVRFLSIKWICHRDIKPTNIMICRQLKPKIIDFGSAVPVFNRNSFNPYEKRWSKGYYYDYNDCSERTRELYNPQQYQQHLYFDSYSLGKTFNFLFKNLQGTKMTKTQQIIMQVITYIIERCSEEDPNNRLSVQQILLFLEELEQFYKDQYEFFQIGNKIIQIQQSE